MGHNLFNRTIVALLKIGCDSIKWVLVASAWQWHSVCLLQKNVNFLNRSDSPILVQKRKPNCTDTERIYTQEQTFTKDNRQLNYGV